MNRNNGRNIAVRLFALRDYLFANADKKHAVRVEDILTFYKNKGFTDNNIKMVYSDLHALQSDELGVYIAYDEKSKGSMCFAIALKWQRLVFVVFSFTPFAI